MRRLILLLLLVPLLSACVGSKPNVVAVLVADGGAEGGRALDLDEFENRVARTCEGCRVEVRDAGGDADTQREQFQGVLDMRVGAVVVEPVDPEVAEEFTVAAEDTPLVAAGSFVPGADWFVGLREPLEAEDGVSSDVDAARDLVRGKEKSYLHVPSVAIGSDAADVVVHLLAKEPLEAPEELEGVGAWLHEPVEVTLANLTTTLVGPGLVSLDELCEGVEKACVRLGLA